MWGVGKMSLGRQKGQFARKSKVSWLENVQRAGFENKNRNVAQETPASVEVNDDRRIIVERDKLANDLWCKQCEIALSLRNIVSERQHGLAFVFSVRCHQCKSVYSISTSSSSSAAFRNSFDVNLKLAVGSVDAGIGGTGVNTLLSALNVPPVSHSLLRRHEKVINPSIEAVANASCKEAINLEKQLTVQSFVSRFQ